MSQEMVEIVQALAPAGDIAALFRDEDAAAAVTEVLAPFFDAEFETLFVRSDIDRAAYRGFDGFRSAWIDWLEPWETYRVEMEELADLGDRVAVFAHDFGRRPGMDREIDFRGLSVWVFRDGLICRVEFHFDRKEGLDTLGLTERAGDFGGQP